MKDKCSFQAHEILKQPDMIDSYQHPLLMVTEWALDTHANDSAKVMNILASKGWMLYEMTSSIGGGMRANTIVIYAVYRRLKG